VRYWEDFTVGDVHRLGTRTVTAEEIVDFARQWDPQPFHVDEQAAAGSSFGGLIASGWHTASITMRMYVDTLLVDSSSQGSPGVEDLRWLAPVRPGDELTVTARVVDATPSATRPDRGTVHLEWEVTNQDGVVAMRMRGRGMFGRRPAG
jgi:acyl dehydratase